MSTQTLWRALIVLATLICIAMMFAPLVGTIVRRLGEDPFLH
jgi:hypothetical protein